MHPVQRLRTALLAASMILGPLAIVLGHLLTVPADESPARYALDIDAARGAFVLSEVLICVGATMLIVNAAGFLRLAPGRGGVLVTVGSVLIGVAATGLAAGNLMFGVVMGMLPPTLGTRVANLAETAPVAGIPWLLAPALPAGVVLVAIGLLLARTVPPALAVLLLLGAVLFLLSGSGGLLSAILLLPMAVAIAGIGVVVWRRRDDIANVAPDSAQAVTARPLSA